MTYPIAPDEHCFCGSTDLRVTDECVEDFRGGMRCVELTCNTCGIEFYVDCDEILPDGTLLHDEVTA